MTGGFYRVLFLSRRNSARSILAEAVLNKLGGGRFEAFSAAVQPADGIEPWVLDLLAANGLQPREPRPRHYGEFAAEGAADLDFVFTLSDTAAGEPLPEWPGQPVTAHWSCFDPVLATGEEWQRKRAFAEVLAELERRLVIFVNLPFGSLDRLSLTRRLDDIGRDEATGAS